VLPVKKKPEFLVIVPEDFRYSIMRLFWIPAFAGMTMVFGNDNGLWYLAEAAVLDGDKISTEDKYGRTNIGGRGDRE